MLSGNDNTLGNGLKASVDWLSFTLLNATKPEDAMSLLGYSPSDFRTASSGFNGYRSRLDCYSCPLKILYDGNENMGVHVDISGSAVFDVLSHFRDSRLAKTPFGTQAYETDSLDLSVFCDLLRSIKEVGQITRIDLAVDDIGTRFFSVTELYNILYSGSYVSKFRKWKNYDEHENSKEITGRTIYLGSRTSEIFLRVYDKQQEQNQKRLARGESLIEYTWVRWELELKKQRAQEVVNLFLSGKAVSEIAVGLLSNYLRLIESDNTRKDRCTVLEKWQKFIDGIAKIRLCITAPEKTFSRTWGWLMRQVAPALAVVIASDGGSLDSIQKLVVSGSGRLKAYHYDMIQQGSGAVA